MIVAKFGGSCLTDNNISKIKQSIDSNCSVVVVSAMGKSYQNDLKVTDMLIALHENYENVSLWNAIANKFRMLVKNHCISIDIESLLSSTLAKIIYNKNYHYTLSVGEEITAKIMARYLGRKYIDASDYIKFNGTELDYVATIGEISQLKGDDYIIGGFYGSNSSGRMTFTRGGGDITGALFAGGLGAELYINYTDVNGLLLADPTVVDCTVTVEQIGYSDMQLLADGGANVLSNRSIYPVCQGEIPINIRNIYNPFNNGTIVCPSSLCGQLLGITDKFTSGKFITTVVHTLGENYAKDVIMQCKNICNNYTITNNCIKLFSKNRIINDVYEIAVHIKEKQ